MRLYRVLLPVGDLAAAGRFYGSLLGVAGTPVSPGRYYLRTGPTILALVDPRADGQDRDPRPNQEHVYFTTPDLEPARARAAALGAGPSEIRDMPWGERSFYLTDPWANPLCIVQEGSEFTDGRVG